MVIFDFEDDDDRVVVISLLNYSLYYKLMHTMWKTFLEHDKYEKSMSVGSLLTSNILA